MSDEQIKILTKEIRSEFQIPPYFEDSALENCILEGEYEFTKLVPNVNFQEDLAAKSLLKNYVYYAYFKRLDDFYVNYNAKIISWQLGQFDDTSI